MSITPRRSVDGLDIRMIQALGVVPFVGTRPRGLEDLARRTSTSVETARRRLRSLATRGILLGRDVWPNPRHMGMRAATFHFDADATCVPRLMDIHGVVSVVEMVGAGFCVDVLAPAPDGPQAVASRLADAAGRPAVAFLDAPLPAVSKPLRPLDWRILQALRQAGGDVPAASRAAGLNPRSVRRRVERMRAAGDLDIIAAIDPGAFEGHLVGYLVVRTRDAGPTGGASVLAALPDRWIVQWSVPGGQEVVVVVVVRSPAALEGLRSEMASLPEVLSARAWVMQAWHATPWLDHQIAKMSEIPHGVTDAVTLPARHA